MVKSSYFYRAVLGAKDRGVCHIQMIAQKMRGIYSAEELS